MSFNAPPASYFVVPANCNTRAQGEMSSTGFSAHGETTIEAQGSGSVDLGTNQSQGEVTLRTPGATRSTGGPRSAPGRSPGMGATEPNALNRVTDVRLRLAPDGYTGPCPHPIRLVGEITTNGPGTVWYRFLAGAVSSSPEGTIRFSAAGTKTVTAEGTIRSTPRVPNASMLAIMQDSAGNHGPQTLSSGPVGYNITCSGQAR